jgi:hypothetical protein
VYDVQVLRRLAEGMEVLWIDVTGLIVLCADLLVFGGNIARLICFMNPLAEEFTLVTNVFGKLLTNI